MCDLLKDYNLWQMVLEPTRESNILDLIITNKVNGVCDVGVVDNLPGTDHDAVLFATNFCKRRPLGHKRWSYNFKRADFTRYRELLSKVDPLVLLLLRDSINDC